MQAIQSVAPPLLQNLLKQADIEINGPRPFDIQIHDKRIYDAVLARWSLGLGEAYTAGYWECEQLDELIARLLKIGIDQGYSGAARLRLLAHHLRYRLFNLQSPVRAYEVGRRHYDLGNDLFECMLDSRMIYSCAYWEHAENLEDAQTDKCRLICEKLELKPGERVLDIGCGWGGLAAYAAIHYGVQVHGITVSREQLALAQSRYSDLPITFELADYRDLVGTYDKIVSVGMFEHVGTANYKSYFDSVARMLKPEGLLDTGADPSECLITGPQLDALSAQMLSERISRVLVFARINPIQKLRIVQTLQQSGEVVGMTGDGVNDAPALKAADIGVAMGVRGTDVAREAASLVLIKEDFGAIVEAVARGRQIFDNLRKAVGFIISIHIPIAGLAVIPVLLGLPQLFYPVHIAFMEMIIDPAGSFIYESEPADPAVMKRPPRPRREFIFPMHLMIKSLIQGILVLGVTLGAYFLLRTFELSENNVRGLLFVGLVSAGLAIVAINMDSPLGRQGDNRRLNPAFLVITTASLAILGLIFSVPVMRDIFNFGAPPLPWFLGALGLGVFNFGLLLASKNIFNRGKYAR